MRRERLESAHLYLVCGERTDAFLHAALRGGVNLVQLRMKDAAEDAMLAAAEEAVAFLRLLSALGIDDETAETCLRAGAEGLRRALDSSPRATHRERIVLLDRWLAAV